MHVRGTNNVTRDARGGVYIYPVYLGVQLLGQQSFAPTCGEQADDGTDLRRVLTWGETRRGTCHTSHVTRHTSHVTRHTLESNPTQYLSFAEWSVSAACMATAQASGGEVMGGALENSTKLLIIHSYLQAGCYICSRRG